VLVGGNRNLKIANSSIIKYAVKRYKNGFLQCSPRATEAATIKRLTYTVPQIARACRRIIRTIYSDTGNANAPVQLSSAIVLQDPRNP